MYRQVIKQDCPPQMFILARSHFMMISLGIFCIRTAISSLQNNFKAHIYSYNICTGSAHFWYITNEVPQFSVQTPEQFLSLCSQLKIVRLLKNSTVLVIVTSPSMGVTETDPTYLFKCMISRSRAAAKAMTGILCIVLCFLGHIFWTKENIMRI